MIFAFNCPKRGCAIIVRGAPRAHLERVHRRTLTDIEYGARVKKGFEYVELTRLPDDWTGAHLDRSKRDRWVLKDGEIVMDATRAAKEPVQPAEVMDAPKSTYSRILSLIAKPSKMAVSGGSSTVSTTAGHDARARIEAELEEGADEETVRLACAMAAVMERRPKGDYRWLDSDKDFSLDGQKMDAYEYLEHVERAA